MSLAKGFRAGLRSFLRPAASDARMDEEFAFHIEMEARKLERDGLSPAAARRRARMKFGGVERHRQEMREGRRGHSLLEFLADLRLASRRLLRRPVFALTVALTLIVGVAALGTAFSVAYGVLLRPLPYPDADRLVMAWQTLPGWQRFPASYPIYDWWISGTTAFEALAAYGTSEAVIADGTEPERVAWSPATANLAGVLGVTPALGRWFTDAEDLDGEPVAVVSHDYWRTRLGGDPNVLGRTIRLDDEPRTVIGVMPQQVRFPSQHTALWTPLGPDARTRGWNSQFLHVIGRLAPDRTVAAAAAELEAVTVAAVAEGEGPEVGSRIVALRDDLVGDVRGTLYLTLAAAIAVLLIGLLNLTNLFLARGITARGELALRSALGAGRLRLGRELVIEGMLLGLAGGAAGLLLVRAAVGSLAAFMPTRIPRLEEVVVDAPVVLTVLSVAVLAGAVLAVVATAAASRGLSQSAFTSGTGVRHTAGRRARRFRRVMVGAQVAGVFALGSGAALLVRSHDRLLAEERGFDESRVVALVEPQPLETRYPDDASRNDLFRRIEDRLRAVPGVRGVALVAPLPFSGSERNWGVVVPDETDPLRVGATEVSAGGLDVLGVRLVRGRGFEPADEGPSAAVTIVGESLARRLRPGGEILGTTIEIPGSGLLNVVGVAADVRQDGLDEPAIPRVWLPWSGIPGDDVSVIAAIDGEPAGYLPALRAALTEVDATLAAEPLAPLATLVRQTAAFPRFRALVMMILAVAAAIIAAVGIYGMTSYAVVEQRCELSIKTALGARAPAVLRDALGHELRVLAAGLAVGIACALLMGRALSGFLHDVDSADPAIHALTGIAILVLASVAALVPAVRAVRADPVHALREE